jgi:hypothetical protein
MTKRRMCRSLVCLVLTGVSAACALGSQSDPPATVTPACTIYMPDGQLKSHSIRIYVTHEITLGQSPRLLLLRSHAVTKKAVDDARHWETGLVAPGQEWEETINGQKVRRTGTLLLFDIGDARSGVRAMMRVTPVLVWTEGGETRTAVGDREVNVGNIVFAMIWTVVAVGITLLAVFLLARRAPDKPLLLLTGVDGHLSLAQTQIACWTIIVGCVVLGYGLIRLDIPDVPSSLLALMGASLATGGVAFFQDGRAQQAAVNQGVVPIARTPALGDLIRIFPPGQAPQLSLAKSQMLFWTVLLLVLFLSKSILEGEIWDVPWGLVALMGFSQAGYLAPKVAPAS